ncbi:hypothetical protein DSM05_03115 [Pseudomonas sp. FW305-3-2-15-E-TSA4]|nr:hypothetical protein [Pseudomonas sp. FW305-3-2-15-E-TSA4]
MGQSRIVPLSEQTHEDPSEADARHRRRGPAGRLWPDHGTTRCHRRPGRRRRRPSGRRQYRLDCRRRRHRRCRRRCDDAEVRPQPNG